MNNLGDVLLMLILFQIVDECLRDQLLTFILNTSPDVDVLNFFGASLLLQTSDVDLITDFLKLILLVLSYPSQSLI